MTPPGDEPAGGAAVELGPGGDGGDELAVFDRLNDIVVGFDADFVVTYVNRFTTDFLGFTPEDFLGHSIIEFVHEDDLVRAAEVIGLIAGGSLGPEITPAVYRIRQANGAWCPIEIVSTPALESGPLRGSLVIVGRYSGDHHLKDQILEQLVTGIDYRDAIAVTPGFGFWRHGYADYGVVYTDFDGEMGVAGGERTVALVRAHDTPASPWGRARAAGGEVLCEADDLPDDLRRAAAEVGLVSCMAIPVGDPRASGAAVVMGWSTPTGPALGTHRYALEQMARAVDLIMQWQGSIERLEQAARFDSLTGIANRRTLFDRFADLRRREPDAALAALFVDLDGFKLVNDQRGHAVGDAVLVIAAERMAAVIRPADLLARVGGDEFVILASGVDDPAVATELAGRIVAAFATPIDVGDQRIPLGASVGVALGRADALSPDDLVNAADEALYAAKSAGRNCWRLAD